MNDYLTFKRMITPLIIQFLFWLLVFITVISAIVTMFTTSFLTGLMFLLLGPLAARLWCEMIVVLFSINDTLTDIRNAVQKPAE